MAVDKLHKARWMHWDIKLDNILLDVTGNVVLADFGLAYDFSNGDMTQGRFGTPRYCSPQVIGNLPYSCKADINSLGVILQANDLWNGEQIFVPRLSSIIFMRAITVPSRADGGPD